MEIKWNVSSTDNLGPFTLLIKYKDRLISNSQYDLGQIRLTLCPCLPHA